MINVYDWYESFSSALDNERKRRRNCMRDREEQDGAQGRKRSGRTQKGTRDQAKTRIARQAQNGRGHRTSVSPTKRTSNVTPSLRGKSWEGKGRTTADVRTKAKGKSKVGVGAYPSGSDSGSDDDGDKTGKGSEDGESEDEEAKETWKMEVHARFVRAVQELDYMGFIRHTGRKADHVHKMVYDVAEYVE